MIPSSASFLADPADVRVELVTERGELSQIRFSGSGHLTDAEATAYSVDAVLRILPEDTPVEIPEAVKEAVTSGDYGEAGMLSEDIYRLLSGWQTLTGSDFWSAAATFRGNCGSLELQEDVKLCRWLVEDATIYSVQENGYGLYLSGGSICDRNGNTVSVSTSSNVDAVKLVEILYSLCMNASADCNHSGERDIYTLVLDSEGMASLAHAIAPETEKMDIAFTSGSLRIVMEQEKIQSAEVSLSGRVQMILSKADASITAALDFANGGEASLPDAVKAALTGGF